MRGLAVSLCVVLAGCVSATDSDLTREQRDQRVRSHTTLAMGYIDNGSFELAMAPLQRALQLNPLDPNAMLAQAALLERQGDSDLAGEAYQRMLDVNPEFSLGRQNYAAFLFGQGQIERACDQFERVVADTLYTNRAQAFENLGVCRQRLQQTDAALAAFERSFRLDNSRPLPNLVLAEARFAQSDLAGAAFHFTNYLQRARQSARSLWLGIRLADAIGDLDSQASYELLLRNQFQDSPEYQQWLEWRS